MKSKKTKKISTNKKSKNLEGEFIIGLNTPKKKNNSKKKKKTKTKKNIKRTKIIKWTSLFILTIVAVVAVMRYTELFNIKQISVINNNKVSTEEIINLSNLKIEENMFKNSKNRIIDNIKTNPYIESVKISKKLNGNIVIDVNERIATYMIELDNGYAYINNQGYILEVSAIKLELPIIKGISTEVQNIIAGNRLNVEDLKRLDVVIQIMKTASEKEISKLITSVDISDNENYILYLESEKKTIHFGDQSSINEKILWVEYAIEENKDVEGTLFVKNVNKPPYFRNKV